MTRKRLRGSAEMSIPLRNAPRRRGMSKEAAADGRWQMADGLNADDEDDGVTAKPGSLHSF